MPRPYGELFLESAIVDCPELQSTHKCLVTSGSGSLSGHCMNIRSKLRSPGVKADPSPFNDRSGVVVMPMSGRVPLVNMLATPARLSSDEPLAKLEKSKIPLASIGLGAGNVL